MGIYREKVLPRIVNKACGMKVAEPLRARVCAGLHGQVLEIGFGTGLNVPHYPAAVTGVAAIEPSDLAWKLAGDRLAAPPSPSHDPGWTARSCPFPTTAATPPCPPGRSARSPTSPPRSTRSGES